MTIRAKTMKTPEIINKYSTASSLEEKIMKPVSLEAMKRADPVRHSNRSQRYTSEQLKEIQKAAKKAKMPLAKFIRSSALVQARGINADTD
jgi:hypothetical protein